MEKGSEKVGSDRQGAFSVPLEVLWRTPPDLKTADCKTICRCDDQCDYAIKDKGEHQFVPHSEWFCTRLGEAVGIACPMPKVVRLDGQLVFGSRWEGGVPTQSVKELIAAETVKVKDINDIVSRIFAFDNFIHNRDRHAGNYLVRSSRDGLVLLAFDYSRAWIGNGFPLPKLPFGGSVVTRKLQRQFRDLSGDAIIPDQAEVILERISKTPKSAVENFINEHPPEWLPGDLKDKICDWWQSEDFGARLNGISNGIRDGSYI